MASGETAMEVGLDRVQNVVISLLRHDSVRRTYLVSMLNNWSSRCDWQRTGSDN